MLVHICCSVDSHYFLSELKKELPDTDFVGFFYNPNIHPKEEHDLRYLDVKRSCEMLNIPLILGEYDTEPFFEQTIGLEDEPEKGDRCVKCFDIRLVRSAIEAQKIGEIDFTSTLLSSPMKEQEVLYQKGDEIAKNYGLRFFKINVRKNGGVNRQNELAKKDNLYRQNYCGCIYALEKQRDNQGKVALELLSSISSSRALGSINERKQTFLKRNEVEQSAPYMLCQRTFMIYRVLHGILKNNDGVIYSYILSNSQNKNAKIKEIAWVKPELDFTLLQKSSSMQGMQGQNCKIALDYENGDFVFGFCNRDDSIFVELSFINMCLQTNFKNILELCKNGLDLESEFLLRSLICNVGSINPIVIIDRAFSAPCELSIKSIFQEEKIFRVVPIAEDKQSVTKKA
ncbi:MAG: epoxyqueuosine reductase QueH [Helicobacter sp.]|nr:epoxyqueuosine reductase QueH [Helicobacter sp.]